MGTGALFTISMTLAAQNVAFAQSSALPPLPSATAITPNASVPRPSAHASLRIDVATKKAWVGQPVAVTLRAYFRNDEGVTVEGAPQLTSSGIFTSDIARDPHQSTEIINGEPVLVATWTGTITPSSAAPLTITAQLPVRVRYRDAAPPQRVEQNNPFGNSPFGSDPFAAFQGGMIDPSMFDHFFQQSMEPDLGRLHEESVSLRASAPVIEVAPLPTADQPATFSGAIGRFDLSSSLSTMHGHVSDPITMRTVVEGDGDLGSVDLSGVPSSDHWKTYPPKSEIDTSIKGHPRKIFEQVLIPLRGGDQIVPSASLTSFDPSTGKYVTRETRPLSISVDGADAPAELTPPTSTSAAPTEAPSLATTDAVPLVVPIAAPPLKIGLWLFPAVLLVAFAFVFSYVRRKRAERALLRAMKAAAEKGDAPPFYRAAHSLIETSLAKRWSIDRDEVSAHLIRDRLGPKGDSLADAVWADDAMRFGRGRVENVNLSELCSSIERSLGDAS
jgi:hypothetical protein